MTDDGLARRGFLKGAARSRRDARSRRAERDDCSAGGNRRRRRKTRRAPAEPFLTLTADEAAFFWLSTTRLSRPTRCLPPALIAASSPIWTASWRGAWGNGARLYHNGPFLPAKPEYGYQLPLTPREYFAAGYSPPMPGLRRNMADRLTGLRSPNGKPP